MKYCVRCCYPENARPAIIFDAQGMCSGCRAHEQRQFVNWQEQHEKLLDILRESRVQAKKNNAIYDCIVPVSGGKDSHFQVYYIKKLGFNPLVVSYNHCFNTALGIRNLTNLVTQFDCNLLRFTSSPGAAKRISKYMLKKIGDITWHYHAGIMTFPVKAAVMYKIPLIIWGEHGFSDLLGMYSQDDMMEFSKKDRKDHAMRGIAPEDILNDPLNIDITEADLAPFYYPTDEEIEASGVRGIYLSNFMPWNAYEQAKLMIEEYNFETAVQRERTFIRYAKLDDIHANGLHDYLKYLKFGYGRATDDASIEIRHGRMTREEAIEMVKKHDHVKPSDMKLWLEFVGMSEDEFYQIVEPLRDHKIWTKDTLGNWQTLDSIMNHVHDSGVKESAIPLIDAPYDLSSQGRSVYKSDGQIFYPARIDDGRTSLESASAYALL